MGYYLAGSYDSWSWRRWLTPGAAWLSRNRRRLARDAAGAPKGSRRVIFSEHAHTLDVLRQLHQVASGAASVLPRSAVVHPASEALIAGASADAPLSMPPAGAPAHLAAVHGGQLIAGPCRSRSGLRLP